MNTQSCIGCGKVKALEEFHKHPQMASGHIRQCKECRRTYMGAYMRTPVHMEKERERSKRRRQTERIQVNARTAANHAIRDGKLFPQPCAVCGEIKVEMHHPDHREPLRVEWLCVAHHHALHSHPKI